MKKLYLIGGTMGVGKTAVSQQLKKDLPNSVFLDGDWCWDANPFQVTEETKTMVTDNICYLLNNFLHCSAYENIIFCWVMHEQHIIDSIIENVDNSKVSIGNTVKIKYNLGRNKFEEYDVVIKELYKHVFIVKLNKFYVIIYT